MKEADKWFSLYVRLNESNADGTVACFICNSTHWYKEVDCAHFIDRDQMSTRYSEVNCHAVCVDCNRFDPDHQDNYWKKLTLKLGLEAGNSLLESKRNLTKFMRHELIEIADKYKHLYQELKKEKGL